MKTLRAILLGALVWVLIFFEVSILMFGFKLETGTTYYIIHYILSAAFVIIASLVYFRKARKGAVRGLLFGIIMTLTGIILDAIITVPLFIHDYSFFLNPTLWIGYLEGIVLATIIGAIKK